MKLVADENIPLLETYFSECDIVRKPGRQITHADLIDANILLVRSVTPVNQALLQGTAVKFVGSTTAGSDHLDTAWLDEQRIAWSVAKGCNAVAVKEYVACVIAALQLENLLPLNNLRAAVIGVGEIGQHVANLLTQLGCTVVLCDPLRTDIVSTPLEQLKELDLISLHVPLTTEGFHPTYHMIHQAFLQRQKPNCVLLNASRGEVIASTDLKLYGQKLIWCLDVWENEPHIDFDTLMSTQIATPHIAGYSLQSKYRGVEMIYQAAIKAQILNKTREHSPDYPHKTLSFAGANKNWREILLSVFDPLAMNKQMKSCLLTNPEKFDLLRKNFMDRYEFQFVNWSEASVSAEDEQMLNELGLKRLPTNKN